MTNQEAKQRLERIWKDYTSAYDTVPIEDLLAFDMATNALGAIDQIQWERDMAIKQLHDLGYGLGEKPREEVKKASDADRILKILESAKDKNGDVPMSIVRKAFDKLLPSAQPDVPDTNVGDMISRRFVELLAEYHDPELCTYKEYKGKPYFSIKYIENGEEYIGYGTYSPKVLSQYLREYFMPSAQPDNHEVACLLAELFGDTCACNFNGIDEWLPDKCEFLDACQDPGGVTCLEQFLKHRAERRADE